MSDERHYNIQETSLIMSAVAFRLNTLNKTIEENMATPNEVREANMLRAILARYMRAENAGVD